MKKSVVKKVGIGLLAVCAIGSFLPNETEEKAEAPEEKAEIVETVDRAIIEEASQEQPEEEEKQEEQPAPVATETTATVQETPTVAVQEPDKQSKTVYITKTGKRYHYDGTCNGGTYYESTLSEALGKGLTPCEKCVH